jgi:hypothetical protein
MSEERMIRVAMEDEDVVLGFLTIADKWGHTRVVDIELESVAPKDWRPHCFFNEAYDIDEPCETVTPGSSQSCYKCPYRKKRE